MTSKEKAAELLALAGITINGSNPWDITVTDERLYDRVITGGALALGESYMDGWWDAKDLGDFFDRVLRAKLETKVGFNLETLFYFLRSHFANLQSKSRAAQVAEAHYDSRQ